MVFFAVSDDNAPGRGMTIRTRLALTSLVLLLPLAVLGYFMDVSFRYDIGIGEAEQAGVAYLRTAYPLLSLIPEHDRLQVRTGQPGAKALVHEARKKAEQQVHEAFEALTKAHGTLVNELGLTVQSVTPGDAPSADPTQLMQLWREQVRVRRPGGAEALLASITGLMSHVGEKARLILDPALDSAYLADAIILSLPRSSQTLARLQQDALANLPPSGFAPPLSGAARDNKLRAAAILEENLGAVMSGAAMALAEDSNYYGDSPSFQERIPPALERCRVATLRLLAALRRLCEEGIEVETYFAALAEARDASQGLYSAGLDELDALIDNRLDSFWAWRYLAAGSSTTAVLIALFALVFTVRRIDRDMRHVGDYARRVEAGDYDAVPSGVRGGEARELTETLRHMVGEIKGRVGYLNGILSGLTVPCLVVDRDERLTFINRPYMELYDREGDPDDYLGMTLGELFYNDKNHETITGRCMKSRAPIQGLEIESTTGAGKNVSVRYDVAPLYDLDGELIGAFCVILDLTGIKEQQREIMWLASFPRENPNPVLSADADGNVTYMNPATAGLITRMDLELERDLLPQDHKDIVAACLASGQQRQGVETHAKDRIFSWNYNPISPQNLIHFYGTDITERKRAEQQILHDAFHDGLTGLPNRALFLDRLGQVLLETQDAENGSFAVLALDLDNFKNINDSLGHSVGDELIKAVGVRLKKRCEHAYTLARLGGDEFALLAEPVHGVSEAMALADRLLATISEPFKIGGLELSTSASVGVVYGSGGSHDAESILRDADTAMFRAKAGGRAKAVLFDEGMHEKVRERFDLEIAMKKGLETDEFVAFYQPLICMQSGRIAGFEALARWEKPDEGIVSPGRFIPLAEESGLVVELGAQMLRRSCRAITAWTQEFSDSFSAQGLAGCGGPTMSVNLSVRQMVLPSIVDDIAAILKETGVDPAQVKIEVTESGIMENAKQAKKVLLRLKNLGVSLSIDDFGTGYSSLSYLTQFPFDFLKVDQSFVRDMHSSAESMEIVKTIVSLAHSLGKQVIAEGIEEQRHYDALRDLGCRFGQGYLFAKPLPEPQARELLGECPMWK